MQLKNVLAILHGQQNRDLTHGENSKNTGGHPA
jgi:hypothetical protein